MDVKTWFAIMLWILVLVAFPFASGWSAPVLLNSNVNIGTDDWGTSISPDGQYFYFSANVGNWDIYRSHWTGSDWGVSEQLSPGNICSSAYEADPFIDWDNQTLYFVSERNGTWDIWCSVLQGGVWTPAQLVPGAVNSDYCNEFNLCITPNHQTMYYSSNQPCGLGSTNIWKCTWDGSGWNNPQPLGMPVNSCTSDYAPKITPDGQFMYFNTERWSLALELCVAEWNGISWTNVQRLPMPPNTPSYDFDCSIYVSGINGTLYYASDISGTCRIYQCDFTDLEIEPASVGFIKAVYSK